MLATETMGMREACHGLAMGFGQQQDVLFCCSACLHEWAEKAV
jgi:hypothetical protein